MSEMVEMVERVALAICCPDGYCRIRGEYDPIKGSVLSFAKKLGDPAFGFGLLIAGVGIGLWLCWLGLRYVDQGKAWRGVAVLTLAAYAAMLAIGSFVILPMLFGG